MTCYTLLSFPEYYTHVWFIRPGLPRQQYLTVLLPPGQSTDECFARQAVEADPHVSLRSKSVSEAEHNAFIHGWREVAGEAQEQKARQRHVTGGEVPADAGGVTRVSDARIVRAKAV